LRIDIFAYFFIILLWLSFYFTIYFLRRPREQEFLWFSRSPASPWPSSSCSGSTTTASLPGIPTNAIYGLLPSGPLFFAPLLPSSSIPPSTEG
jgi:hypothetical protein